MSYIWENYSENNKFSIGNDVEKSSFIEAYKIKKDWIATPTACNDETSEETIVVNLMLRFASIFSLNDDSWIATQSTTARNDDCESKSNEYLRDEIINIIVHYLAQKDLINGTYYTDYYLLLFQDEIEKGAYGEEVRDRFSKLSDLDKRLILKYMSLKHKQNNINDLFSDVFMDMFGRINNMFNEKTEWNSSYTKHSAEIYYSRDKNTYYYFCAAEPSEKNKNRFEIAKLIFADCRKNIEPVWGKYCFGVIDEYILNEAAIPVIDGIQII